MLNLENNKLSKLPNTIGHLHRLQTLHLKGRFHLCAAQHIKVSVCD